jgi:hypothetical protein
MRSAGASVPAYFRKRDGVMVSPSGAPGARRCGQAADRQWAESPSSLQGRPLRLSPMRRERGSVDVVSPASSRFERTETEEQARGSLDWISTALSPRRPPGTRTSSNAWGASTCAVIFSRLSQRSSPRRIVVLEATDNAATVAAVIAPHVKQVVIANPKQRASSLMRDQNGYDRRESPRPALRARVSAGDLDA